MKRLLLASAIALTLAPAQSWAQARGGDAALGALSGAVVFGPVGAVAGAVVGYTAYIWLLRHCEPAKVATYAYVNPIVAVLLGTFFAGETVTVRTLVAAALIIGSVALIITAQQLRARVDPGLNAAIEPAD